MPDSWISDGVIYTIDAKENVGGAITAQKESATTIHSRIVSKLMQHEEAEKLFELDLKK